MYATERQWRRRLKLFQRDLKDSRVGRRIWFRQSAGDAVGDISMSAAGDTFDDGSISMADGGCSTQHVASPPGARAPQARTARQACTGNPTAGSCASMALLPQQAVVRVRRPHAVPK